MNLILLLMNMSWRKLYFLKAKSRHNPAVNKALWFESTKFSSMKKKASNS